MRTLRITSPSILHYRHTETGVKKLYIPRKTVYGITLLMVVASVLFMHFYLLDEIVKMILR